MALLAPSRRGAALAALVAACALYAVDAEAFHSGGAADCDGCHTMHNSDGGAGVGEYLLQGADPSSVCLNCHSGLTTGASSVLTVAMLPGLPPTNYTPGGDFGWLEKSYSWAGARNQQETSPGERHGHNVVANDYGLTADGTRSMAPGGWYPADKLSCTSCHDPHGKYRQTNPGSTFATTGAPIAGSGTDGDPGSFRMPTGTAAIGSYRLLAGEGYAPLSTTGIPAFSWAPPIAVAPSLYNKSERTGDVRVAYGAGMSEWCGNCHGALHSPYSGSPSELIHPAGSTAKLSTSVLYAYNAYVKDGVLTGTASTSYTSLVPYEEGTTDRVVLAAHARSDGGATSGPGTGMENVMCLSCHRAHASGWDFALRWNPESQFLVVEGVWPGIDAPGGAANALYAQGRTQAETRGAMYDRDPAAYAPFQKSLCNKCHGK
jgi:predicted CXXCH cytochrome family protein